MLLRSISSRSGLPPLPLFLTWGDTINNECLFHASEMLVISHEISIFVYEKLLWAQTSARYSSGARGQGGVELLLLLTIRVSRRAKHWRYVTGSCWKKFYSEMPEAKYGRFAIIIVCLVLISHFAKWENDVKEFQTFWNV